MRVTGDGSIHAMVTSSDGILPLATCGLCVRDLWCAIDKMLKLEVPQRHVDLPCLIMIDGVRLQSLSSSMFQVHCESQFDSSIEAS